MKINSMKEKRFEGDYSRAIRREKMIISVINITTLLLGFIFMIIVLNFIAKI